MCQKIVERLLWHQHEGRELGVGPKLFRASFVPFFHRLVAPHDRLFIVANSFVTHRRIVPWKFTFLSSLWVSSSWIFHQLRIQGWCWKAQRPQLSFLYWTLNGLGLNLSKCSSIRKASSKVEKRARFRASEMLEFKILDFSKAVVQTTHELQQWIRYPWITTNLKFLGKVA